jgi:hypothetical protein
MTSAGYHVFLCARTTALNAILNNKVTAHWDMMPCNLVVTEKLFKEMYYFRLQDIP